MKHLKDLLGKPPEQGRARHGLSGKMEQIDAKLADEMDEIRRQFHAKTLTGWTAKALAARLAEIIAERCKGKDVSQFTAKRLQGWLHI